MNGSRKGVFSVPLANSIVMLNRAGMRAVHAGVNDDFNKTRLNQTDVDNLWPWMVAVKVSQWIRHSGGAVLASNVINAGYVSFWIPT